MKDQVYMSPMNGNLVVAVPLFRFQSEEVLEQLEGYSISLTNGKPIAYAIDMGESIQLMNAEFVESKLECLGDL